jgi:mannose-6-phosphate isomerase-like protein (cupin superfamily)
MRNGLVVAGLLATVLPMSLAQGRRNATYVGHAKVAAAASGDNLATGPDFKVLMMKRTAAGRVEVHEKETDTFYVLDGEATFVTGGTMIGGRTSRPNQQLGQSIQGGNSYHLSRGDVIVIPAGTPHWFKEVSRSISYYTVKVIKP